MGKTILCNKCRSTFDEAVLSNRSDPDTCPVCGASLLGEEGSGVPQKEKCTYYYYKERGGTLTTTLYDREPLYIFKAVDMADAERQLKQVMPNSPLLNDNSPDKVRCPRCRSTGIQLVPRKFSLLTGFATNKFDRVCVRCKKRF